MLIPVAATAIFIAVFAIATVRDVHLGILMLPAACGVGVWMAGIPLKDVMGGFPVSLMVLLVGVTYFFGIAQVNGTIDRLIRSVLGAAGTRTRALPFVFFALTGAVAAMGSPIAGLVLAPVGMPVAKRSGIDPMLMAIAMNAGISAGGLAPTSLFGIVTYGTARQAGIELNPFTLLLVASVANFSLLIVASWMFRGIRPRHDQSNSALASSPSVHFDWRHAATMVCLIGLVGTVIACAAAGIDPDIGVIALAFGAILTLVDPRSGSAAVSKIDWSTVLLVGGIITFVGVLQKLGVVDLLGEAAKNVGTPLVAALVICAIAGLVSAFASTTGILAVLVPLAVPLALSGDVAGWALISAMGVCASIVDVSPFSTTGATLIASADEGERPRMRSLLMRWAMSMVVVGPVVFVAALAILARLSRG